MVFAGLYPHDESGFEALQHAMGRFLLKDASVRVEAEHSPSLGRGLRCGSWVYSTSTSSSSGCCRSTTSPCW